MQGAELHCAVGFECDADETYWQHYTTRHNKSKYAGLRSELELAINREFNGSAHAAATTVACASATSVNVTCAPRRARCSAR